MHFFHQVEQTNKIYLSTQRFMSNVTLPCDWIKPVDNQNENLYAVPSDNSDRSFTSESKSMRSNLDSIWKEVLFSGDCISKLRTWESLGAPEFSKQSLFVTDLPETALHLARIRQTSILSLLPKKVKITMLAQIYHAKIVLFMLQAMHSVSLMREISSEKFLSDVKLLLFGIDSDSFKYDTVVCGFNKCQRNRAFYVPVCHDSPISDGI